MLAGWHPAVSVPISISASSNARVRSVSLPVRARVSRRLPDTIKLWMGDSRGRWEGNTLVIEARNHNDLTWFDQAGGYHSDALHVVERLRFVDADTISYEATFQDPKAYTKPWKIAFPILRHKEAGFELLEDACFEGVQGDAALYAPRSNSPEKAEQKPQ